MNKLIHYIIFCSLFFTACSEETLPKDTPVSPDGKGVEIILNLAPQPLQAPAPTTKSSAGNNNPNVLASSREGAMSLELLAEQPDAATRATAVDETTIDNAWIFLFDGVFSDGANGTSTNDPKLIKKLYKSDFQNDKGIRLTKIGESGNQQIVVLANSFDPTLAKDLVEYNGNNSDQASKYSALKELFSTVDIPANRRLPMVGTKDVEIQSTSENEVKIEVPVTRIVAKITMNVKLATPGDFPNGYWTAQLCDIAPAYWYPNPDVTTTPFPKATETFSFPDEENITLTGSYTVFTWYAPANRRGTSSASSTTGADRFTNAPDRATYVRLTHYNKANNIFTQRNYYIHLGANFTDDYNILGNTHYTYNVTLYLNAGEDSRVKNITAVYAGMFGGELKATGGVWQFTKELWVQSVDAATGISSSTMGTDTYNGKSNTLSKKTSNPAQICFKKNEGYLNINSTTDSNYRWYLPAQRQLDGIWIAQNSFDNSAQLSDVYWSSTSAWWVDFKIGSSKENADSGHNSNKVRCVIELESTPSSKEKQ